MHAQPSQLLPATIVASGNCSCANDIDTVTMIFCAPRCDHLHERAKQNGGCGIISQHRTVGNRCPHGCFRILHWRWVASWVIIVKWPRTESRSQDRKSTRLN